MYDIVTQKCGFYEESRATTTTTRRTPATTTTTTTRTPSTTTTTIRTPATTPRSVLESRIKTLTDERDECQSEVSEQSVRISDLQTEVTDAKLAQSNSDKAAKKASQDCETRLTALRADAEKGKDCDALIQMKLTEINSMRETLAKRDLDLIQKNELIKTLQDKLKVYENPIY